MMVDKKREKPWKASSGMKYLIHVEWKAENKKEKCFLCTMPLKGLVIYNF